MNEAKRKYWLQLPQNYFGRLAQKKMRKQPDGIRMQVVYLKMLLMGLGCDGHIIYQGIYDTLEEEIAEELDEDREIVQATIAYILENHLAREESDEMGCGYFLPESDELTGGESESAERVRRFRERQKKLRCNDEVTDSNGTVTNRNDNKEDKNKEEVEVKQNIKESAFTSTSKEQGDGADARPEAGASAVPYSLEDFRKVAAEVAPDMSEVQLHNCYNQLKQRDFMLNGRPVQLPNAIRGYAKRHPGKAQKTEPEQDPAPEAAAAPPDPEPEQTMEQIIANMYKQGGLYGA